MLLSRLIAATSSVIMLVLVAGVVFGQAFPNKPLRIVTYPPGGGGDFVAREIARTLTDRLGQPVIVDNRPGVIPVETVAKAPPDGYTLLVFGSNLWILPLLQDKLSWDAVRDFAPISMLNASPLVVIVHPSLTAKSVKELIALAKARPGALNYAIGALGGATHLAGELFKSMAGVNIVGVPYKSNGPAITAILGGEVQVMFVGTTGIEQHFKSGKLRALGVASAGPSALLPGVPTVAANGLAGFEAEAVNAVFAPAKTSASIIRRLNQEIVRFLNTPEEKERLLKFGSEAVGSSPEQLAATIKSDITKLGKVIKDAGIKLD